MSPGAPGAGGESDRFGAEVAGEGAVREGEQVAHSANAKPRQPLGERVVGREQVDRQ